MPPEESQDQKYESFENQPIPEKVPFKSFNTLFVLGGSIIFLLLIFGCFVLWQKYKTKNAVYSTSNNVSQFPKILSPTVSSQTLKPTNVLPPLKPVFTIIVKNDIVLVYPDGKKIGFNPKLNKMYNDIPDFDYSLDKTMNATGIHELHTNLSPPEGIYTIEVYEDKTFSDTLSLSAVDTENVESNEISFNLKKGEIKRFLFHFYPSNAKETIKSFEEIN